MSNTKLMVGTNRSRDLVEGVAATLRNFERTASGVPGSRMSAEGAMRRLDSFQRALARALQQAHLETVQEFTGA